MTTDPTGRYIDQMAKTPLLSPEDEVRLSALVQAGIVAQKALEGSTTPAERRKLRQTVRAGEEAKEQFIKANMLLVVSIAKKFHWSGMPLDDLIQEGMLGMMHAVDKYDGSLGNRFSTYSVWWIKQAMGKAVENVGRTVRVPGHMGGEIRRMAKIREMLSEGGREVPVEELAAACGMPMERLLRLVRADEEPISLDAGVRAMRGSGGLWDEETVGNSLPDPNVDIEQQVLDALEPEISILAEPIAKLGPIQQDVVRRRLAGMERDEIADELDMGPRSVTNTETKARARLRELIGVA